MRAYLFHTLCFILYLNIVQAQITEIPDPIFEGWLIDRGYDSDQTINGQVLTNDIDFIDFIEINHIPPQYDIQDFTGIEDFASLETFIANFTSVTFINFGNQPELTRIEMISHPNLTSIDISGLDNLEIFDMGGTSLESIELPTSNTLEVFSCNSGDLLTLDLSNFTNLTFVGLSNHSLTSLNIANGNNTNITTFITTSNPDLTCILVDDIAYSEANWTSIEPGTEFVDEIEDCPGLLTVASPVSIDAAIFPNPANDYFKVGENVIIQEIIIYDLSGKLVKTFAHVQDQYLVDDLASGLYVLRIQTDTYPTLQKLIIQ